MPARPPGTSADHVAFLLAQVGHRAATLFAELLLPLDLTPPLAGIVRLIHLQPGLSQQELSGRLQLLPSRVVAFVDELETRGYVTRQRNETDRRLYALHLTAEGRELMGDLGKVAREQDRQITAGLSADQRTTLRELLAHIAERQDLAAGIHPGYRTIRTPETGRHRRSDDGG